MLADRLGVLVINEIPAVGLNFEDPEELTARRLAQCRQQLRELIARDKNHPSTIMWSVANEPMARRPLGVGLPVPEAVEAGTAVLPPAVRRGAPARRDAARDARRGAGRAGRMARAVRRRLHQPLLRLVHAAGAARPGGGRSWSASWMRCTRRFGKPIIMTEFGADTLPGVHNQPPEMWTEEYQVEFLRALPRRRGAAAVRGRACTSGTSPTSRPARASSARRR